MRIPSPSPDVAGRIAGGETPLGDALAPRRIASEQLLGASGQAVIVHRGREYRLRETQNGKLILTA